MRIAYIANHNNGGNDDEGAIGYALEQLGHTVVRLPEQDRPAWWKLNQADFVLFHKLHRARVKHIATKVKVPLVFWYFDLVDFPDSSLNGRNSDRRNWMRSVSKFAQLGFCTDGDWVDKDKSGKLVCLSQGADERIVGRHPGIGADTRDILFTGIGTRAGSCRAQFVDEMRGIYRNRFTHIQRGTYRNSLAKEINRYRIVVAPDYPVTDKYWSNRVYVSMGFGAFLIHPYCARLAEQFEECHEIVYYTNRHELHGLIRNYLDASPDVRRKISEAGMGRTIQNHTYRHRCAQLIETIKERLL